MRRMHTQVRQKAIEIAGLLLCEGMDEGKAMHISMAKAKEWEDHRDGESSSANRLVATRTKCMSVRADQASVVVDQQRADER